MYNSFGSYSSLSSMSAPINITPSNFGARDATCAFPSWPRRSSLSESEHEERATSFLSDDDLFLCDPFDDNSSISSSSTASSPNAIASPPRLSEEELLEMEQQRMAMQREYVRQVMLEKERRRQASKKSRRPSSGASSKKSSKVKLSSMAPICEIGE